MLQEITETNRDKDSNGSYEVMARTAGNKRAARSKSPMFGQNNDSRRGSGNDFMNEINNQYDEDDEGPRFGGHRQSSSTMLPADLNNNISNFGLQAKAKMAKKKNSRPNSMNLGGVGGLGSLGKSVINQDVAKLEKKQRDPVEAMIAKYSLPRTEEDLDSDDDLQNQRKKLGGLQSIAVMQDQVEQLKVKNQMFCIEIEGVVRDFHFYHDDDIFSLAAKNENKSANQNANCNCCQKAWNAKNKDISYCDYCALAYCLKCQYKQRRFPNGKENSLGNICKVCDRKFNLRELLKDRNLQIEAQTNQLLSKNGMMAQVEQHEQKNNQIRREGRKQAKIYATDIKKMQILVDKLEYKVQNIKNQQEQLQKQSNEYVEKQGQLQKQSIEQKDQMEQHKQEQQKNSDELDTINNHIILTQQEYRKLDFEWKELEEKERLLAFQQAQREQRRESPTQPSQSQQTQKRKEKKQKKKEKKEKRSKMNEDSDGSADNVKKQASGAVDDIQYSQQKSIPNSMREVSQIEKAMRFEEEEPKAERKTSGQYEQNPNESMMNTTQAHQFNPIITESADPLIEHEKAAAQSRQTSRIGEGSYFDSAITASNVLNTEGVLDRDEDDEYEREQQRRYQINPSSQYNSQYRLQQSGSGSNQTPTGDRPNKSLDYLDELEFAPKIYKENVAIRNNNPSGNKSKDRRSIRGRSGKKGKGRGPQDMETQSCCVGADGPKSCNIF